MSGPLTVRGTAALLGVLATLLGYLWLVELPARRAAPPPDVEGPPLLAVPATGVARVAVKEGGASLTAVRADDGWTDPSGRPWRGSAVADLVDTLGTLRALMIVDPAPRDPADYGLGTAARRLEVSGTDGRPVLELELGERNPAWTAIYARHVGRPEVILVGSVLGWELEKVRSGAPDPEP